MALPTPRYYCPACKHAQHQLRCALCGRDCEDSEEGDSTPAPPPAGTVVGYIIMYRFPGRPWGFYGSGQAYSPAHRELAERDMTAARDTTHRVMRHRYEFALATVTVPA